MSTKRKANLSDQEEEPEEPGTFKSVSEEELRSRVIRKVRKITGRDEAASILGIENPSTSSSLASAFQARLPTTEVGISSTLASAFPFPSGENARHKDSEVPAEPLYRRRVSSEYRENVATLNREVTKFIKDHIDKNPYCILTPVFDNYNKHLKDLNDKEAVRSGKQNSTSRSPLTTEVTPNNLLPLAGISFGKSIIPITGTSDSLSELLFGITGGTSTTTATKTMFTFEQNQAIGSITKSITISSATTNMFGFSILATAKTDSGDGPKTGFCSLPRKANGYSLADENSSTSTFTRFANPPNEEATPPETARSTATTAEHEDEDEDTPPKVKSK